MRAIKKFQILVITFYVGIWMLLGCNSIPTIESDTDPQTQTKVDTEGNKTPEEGEIAEETGEPPSTVDLVEFELSEDMLAYWMALNSKKPFVSVDEGYQEFYWDEYYWCLGEIRGRRQADCFMVVDMNGDGANEVVLECSPESTQVLYYEKGIVYSFQFNYRGMKRIHDI